MRINRRCLFAFSGLYVALYFLEQLGFPSSFHNSHAAASDLATARREVMDWLDDQPRQARDEPPNDLFPDLRLKWIERGKRIPLVEDVLIQIIEDKTSRHRSIAALVVGRVGSAKALDALKEVFDTDDPRLQLNAIESICAIDSPRRVEVLAAALKSTYRQPQTPDNSIPTAKAIVRANIAIALARIEDEKAKRLLKTLLSAEKDQYVLEAVKKVASSQ